MDFLCPGDPTDAAVVSAGLGREAFRPVLRGFISFFLLLRCAGGDDRKSFLALLFLNFAPRRTVLGLGGNVVAAVAVLALFIARRNASRAENVRRRLPEKLFVFGIPSFAACLSLLGLIVLVKKKIEGIDVPNHESFFRCSQFLAWVAVLISANGPWSEILCNPIICICWMLKILLEIPHLQYRLTEMKAMAYVTEIVSFSTSITFGLFLIVITAVHKLCNKREVNSIEAPLIPNNENSEAENANLVLSFSMLYILSSQVNKQHNVWELLTFKSVNPMMDIGIRRQLDFTDLLELPAELRTASCYDKLLSSWTAEHQKYHADSSLLRAMFYAYGWSYLRLGILKVINDSISFVSPLLLNKFIKLIQEDTQYSFRLAKLKLMLRSSMMGIVYRKIGLALYLLYTQVNYAFLSGLAITIILIPVNKWISTRIATATQKMMKQKDERISCAGELLAHIRTVKMYSWDKLFTQRLNKRRELEVKHLAGVTPYMDSFLQVFTCVALFNTLISPLNSLPWVINGMIDSVISSRRLHNYLSTPEHCSSELTISTDIVKDDFNRNTETINDPTAVIIRNLCCSWSSISTVEPHIILRDISLQLQKGLFIAIVGELFLLIGRKQSYVHFQVGSGKSSLLNSIIGEMSVISGSINSCGSIAYVPQVPWILSGSLRDNILLGKGFDTRRYEEVIQACTLDVDISTMTGGDMSHIGEKGLNLSGGQRARLALVRALYHDSDVYLFDDILSAVDSQVASWILEKAIMGPQMKRKTRLLSTHNLQAIYAADMIVVMGNGFVKWFGTLDSFLETPYSKISNPDSSSAVSATSSRKDKGPSTAEFKTKDVLDNGSEVDQEEQRDQTEAEGRKEGMVEIIVYKKYATLAGWSMVFLIFVSALLMQASRNGNDLWLTYWVDSSSGTNNTRFYLTILAGFGIINSFFTLGRAFSFAYGGLCAAIQIHADLLGSLIGAPVSFFDQNPSGRILNRLSSDLYTVDDSLPFILNIFVANFFGLLGTLVVLCYSQVTFLLILVPLWLIYSKVQFYYRSTSREVRRLDSVARSPIYSSFTETLDGSSTIRAFQKEGFFLERFIQQLTLYQKTSYSELTASLWLSLRLQVYCVVNVLTSRSLQLLAGLIILFIAVISVVGFHSNSPVKFGTPGLVGLALSYAAPVVSLLNGFLTTFTETEKEMISVERVVEYVGIPQEELQGSESPDRSWPTEGRIEFEHVTLRYKADLPPALNEISFHIESGMQVGIIGRTGAGKSSILNALFRLTPICNGRILVDGFDVAKVAVRDLRGHFAVVPQSPFLFDGSLRELNRETYVQHSNFELTNRENLDPFGITTDIRIWEALEKCHMKAEIESIGGLDIHVKESGGSFSVGQRQLLCLARAILKSSKVLCLDECTANVDNQTAFLLQNTISSECKGMTVLTIAHRISTVMKMDNILVLDQGKLVEEGNPEVLMNDNRSRFSRSHAHLRAYRKSDPLAYEAICRNSKV
ncbi:ABC transporter C family member 13 [Triticum urartu]|uniref:ABC transporter C family member 13 n=1 Tax=Triticum urartu TaxID=4572 RepID=M7Z691_TRIUA|nr:ABC transporter C family member 13 [Triticum urartu]